MEKLRSLDIMSPVPFVPIYNTYLQIPNLRFLNTYGSSEDMNVDGMKNVIVSHNPSPTILRYEVKGFRKNGNPKYRKIRNVMTDEHLRYLTE